MPSRADIRQSVDVTVRAAMTAVNTNSPEGLSNKVLVLAVSEWPAANDGTTN